MAVSANVIGIAGALTLTLTATNTLCENCIVGALKVNPVSWPQTTTGFCNETASRRSIVIAADSFAINLADDDTLARFYRSQTNTRTEFTQLASGDAVLQAVTADLGPVRLLQVTADGHHLWKDWMLGDEWRFAMIADAGSTIKIGSKDIKPQIAQLLRPGEDCELITTGRYRTIEITFSEALAMDSAWDCRAGQVAELDEQAAAALKKTCLAALTSLSVPSETGIGSADRADKWADIIIDQLELALQPWLSPEPADPETMPALHRYELVRRARHYLDDHDYAKTANVNELARMLNVAPRTLFDAFRRELGIGPRRYGELVRLNGLRGKLFRSSDRDVTVTEAANEYGFSELGRLAGVYYRAFGEKPSDTLRRSGH